MKANELRIGNLVSINKRTTTMDVKTFHAVIHGFSGYDPEPIVLTEKWVLKLGFEQDVKFFKHENFEVERQDGFFWYRTINDYLEVTYVHQLQNLYFALTGEELV